MGFDDCYLLGKLIKTHGLHGELSAFFDVDEPEAYQELESVFVDQNGKLVPFFIESIAIRENKAILAFDDIEDIDTASTLVGCSLYLPLDFLPKLPNGGYYFHQLVGMDLYDQDKLIGQVKNVLEISANNLIVIDHEGTEVMVPLDDGIIQNVDLIGKRIDAELPDGLIDLYLES